VSISEFSNETLLVLIDKITEIPMSDAGLVMKESLKRLMQSNQPERLNPEAPKGDAIV
jgi:hypothetical protein